MTAEPSDRAPHPPREGRRVVRCRGIGCGQPLTDPLSRALEHGPGCKDRLPDPHVHGEQDPLPGL